MDKPQDISLRDTFDRVKQMQQELDSLDPRSVTFKDNVQTVTECLERCHVLIKDLSIFSSNEELEDLSTQNLQYLTVDYLLADLLLKSYDNNRLVSLRRSLRLLESFLERLDQYNMLSKADRKLHERFQENRSTFSLLPTSNAEERRRLKINRFQEEKQLKKKLEYLRTQAGGSNVDDETIRGLYLAEIAFFVHQTFQSLDMITQESSILAQMQQAEPIRQNGAPDDPRRPQRSDGYSERLDGPATIAGLGGRGGPLLSSSGKPLQPFTLLDKRSEFQKGVFRPGHNLPTMTMDEYLEEERRRGGIVDGGGNANAPQPELDEDNMDLVDAATMKAREWDEFVEANPKGAGNTLNKG